MKRATTHRRASRFLSVLFIGLAAWTSTSLGQSLSIVNKGHGECWAIASPPAASRYSLQASKNLKLWLDLNETLSGTVSNKVGGGVGQAYFRLVPWTEQPPITLALVGDSTVADLESNLNYFNGWGQGMYGYFNDKARIINLARVGYGTKNFLTSQEKTTLILLKPEYVLVQFGLIDAMGVPEVKTTLEEYEENLRTIVQIIRGFNGTPILITPQAIRIYHPDQLVEMFPTRDAVIKKLAAELQIHLIDLNYLSLELFNRLGRSGSDDLWATTFPNEWMHFSTKGADVIAGLVVNVLPAALGPYIRAERILSF